MRSAWLQISGGLTACFVIGLGCSSGPDGGATGGHTGTPTGGATGGATVTGGASGGEGATRTGGARATGGMAEGGAAQASAGRGGAAGGGAGGEGGRGKGGRGNAGAAGTGGANGGNPGGGGAGGAMGAIEMSGGCGKAPTLASGSITLQSAGKSRKYTLRLPEGYDNKKPYRLILGFHGATGNATEVATAQNNGYFGLYALAAGSTIFVATEAVGGLWAASDVTYVGDVLKQVEDALCVDTKRVGLEGFSQGAAMVWTMVCARPKIFRFAVGHSGGGLTAPTTCEPIAYLGSLGLQENGGQTTQTDKFAQWNGCTAETLPKASSGSHLCSDYKGCSAGHPVRWCPYDGGHTPAPTDAGQRASWMPKEVWSFVSQF